ncbi:uncharacterized protein EI97DRAFT_468267, partial [Westerdykella ornata]
RWSAGHGVQADGGYIAEGYGDKVLARPPPASLLIVVNTHSLDSLVQLCYYLSIYIRICDHKPFVRCGVLCESYTHLVQFFPRRKPRWYITSTRHRPSAQLQSGNKTAHNYLPPHIHLHPKRQIPHSIRPTPPTTTTPPPSTPKSTSPSHPSQPLPQQPPHPSAQHHHHETPNPTSTPSPPSTAAGIPRVPAPLLYRCNRTGRRPGPNQGSSSP